jgi:hypothetical protein
MKRLAFVAALLMLASSAWPAAAASPDTVVADLEGTSITVESVPDHFCYDHDFPRIHCFKTSASLKASLDAATSSAPSAVAATDYVVVFSSPSYAGSYMYISQDYDALAVVGWNDRVRSYRALNGARGIFWTDWFQSGTGQSFCCNQTVPVLSATFDRQFSSVYRR